MFKSNSNQKYSDSSPKNLPLIIGRLETRAYACPWGGGGRASVDSPSSSWVVLNAIPIILNHVHPHTPWGIYSLEVNIANLSSQVLRVKIPGMCYPNERSEQLKIQLCTWEHDHSYSRKEIYFGLRHTKASAESKESDPSVKPLCAKPSLVAQWCANEGDMGSTPGLGRSHVPEGATGPVHHNWVCALEPRSPSRRGHGKEGP